MILQVILPRATFVAATNSSVAVAVNRSLSGRTAILAAITIATGWGHRIAGRFDGAGMRPGLSRVLGVGQQTQSGVLAECQHSRTGDRLSC